MDNGRCRGGATSMKDPFLSRVECCSNASSYPVRENIPELFPGISFSVVRATALREPHLFLFVRCADGHPSPQENRCEKG